MLHIWLMTVTVWVAAVYNSNTSDGGHRLFMIDNAIEFCPHGNSYHSFAFLYLVDAFIQGFAVHLKFITIAKMFDTEKKKLILGLLGKIVIVFFLLLYLSVTVSFLSIRWMIRGFPETTVYLRTRTVTCAWSPYVSFHPLWYMGPGRDGVFMNLAWTLVADKSLIRLWCYNIKSFLIMRSLSLNYTCSSKPS